VTRVEDIIAGPAIAQACKCKPSMRFTRELQSECQDGGVSCPETRWLVQRSRGARAAKLRCTSRLSARMLIKIRNLEVVMSRRLNVLHALSNVLQAECRGFRIDFEHSQQQAHHNRQIPMSKYRYEVRREDPSVQTRRSMSGPASQATREKSNKP
jgi:hypothetical protein